MDINIAMDPMLGVCMVLGITLMLYAWTRVRVTAIVVRKRPQ